MIVDSAIYVNGARADGPGSLEETYEACRAAGGVAWIGLYKPTEGEFGRVAEEFGLHELAVEDAIGAHQRSKLERYGDTLFLVLRSARYLDATETVEFAELHVFVGPDFVVTARHGEGPDLSRVRRRMESESDILRHGSEAILYAVLDRVVDDYEPVVAGLQNDIDEIETEVFGGNADVTRRTYELASEVIEFQRATKPLVAMLSALITGAEQYGVDPELRLYLRDVQDHAIQVQEQVAGFRELLQNILNVNLAVVGLQQNEEVKALIEASIDQNEEVKALIGASIAQAEEVKALTEASIAQADEVKRISSWAAILFAPTLIGTVYGMNFTVMPELDWRFGYPFALLLMILVAVAMYVVFKARGWLS